MPKRSAPERIGKTGSPVSPRPSKAPTSNKVNGRSTSNEPHRDLPERIKRLRQSRNLTLAEMAKLIGTTKGFLSRVENGAKGISIPTLLKVSSALDAPIGYFLNVQRVKTAPFSIVRSGEREVFQRSGTDWDYKFQSLAFKKKHKIMEPLVTSPPQKPPPEPFVHSGEEMIFVLNGQVRLELGAETFILGSGDCAYYDGSTPHRSSSFGKRRATALLVISFESFDHRKVLKRVK
jgi:transcriptional regulator with XRE-family HTH domain